MNEMSFYNPTSGTWQIQATQQANNLLGSGKFNVDEFPNMSDPIYGKLIQQITKTVYRRNSVDQMYRNIGVNAEPDSYSGIVREIMMLQRKGQNFPWDDGTTPTTLNSYEIYDDEIETRYHSAQFRWMYPYTLFDYQLRQFAGQPSTIASINEEKAINMSTARNMFMDSLRIKMLNVAVEDVGTSYNMGDIDITDFDTLTEEQAKQWLVALNELFVELKWGTVKYSSLDQFQRPRMADLQFIIPEMSWNNVMRRAFPDMYHAGTFENIVPEGVEIILVGDMGNTILTDASGTEIVPTFNSVGMNTTNYLSTYKAKLNDDGLQGIVMHRGALGFEDSLNETLVGDMDIAKLAVPVRSHFWTKAYYTDLLPCIKLMQADQ